MNVETKEIEFVSMDDEPNDESDETPRCIPLTVEEYLSCKDVF
jgi:hypothetical protein